MLSVRDLRNSYWVVSIFYDWGHQLEEGTVGVSDEGQSFNTVKI